MLLKQHFSFAKNSEGGEPVRTVQIFFKESEFLEMLQEIYTLTLQCNPET
jgi:hypothetical protein